MSIQFFQEAVTSLPKLTQTPLFIKFNENTQVVEKIREAVRNQETRVKPEELKDIMALIRLNGSPIAKKATQAFESGKMVIIFDPDRSKIPETLPFIVIQDNKNNTVVPFIFADRVVSKITSTAEYPNLMATMEAAYLAAALQKNPKQFLLNRQLVLALCCLYNFLWLMPLEQKLYMKGENLTKAMMYITSFFYKLVDGNSIEPSSIPFNRVLKDKVSPERAKQFVDEVRELPSISIDGLIGLIKQINPVRYENLNVTFMNHFVQSCGVPVLFALENIQYLFLLMTSSYYKTKITQYGLNKTASDTAKKCVSVLSSMNITY